MNVIATASDMLAWLPVLSASDDLDIGKLIFFAIGLIIWIISAISKSIAKPKQEQTWTGEEWVPTEQLPGGQPAADDPHQAWTPPQAPVRPSPGAPILQQAPPAYPPEWLGQAPVSRPPPLPAVVKRASKPPLPPVTQVVPETAATTSAYEAKGRGESGQRTGTGVRPLDARLVRRWMTPEVMRRQFILTELFDPPPSGRRTDKPIG